MRLVYLDESGIANPRHEPWATVSGIIVDADNQLDLLESRLIGMADKYAPPKKREGFVFHAKELFSAGSVYPREDYSKEYRWAILQELVNLPREFDLPVVLGLAERATTFPDAGIGTKDHTSICVAQAFLACVAQVERFMRTLENEVALLVVENNDDNRQIIKKSFQLLKNSRLITPLMPDELKDFAPFTKIKETPLFAGKNDSSLLQIADACAFVGRRHVMHKVESAMFYKPLSDQLIMRPKSDYPMMTR